MPVARVLVIDDEPDIRSSIALALPRLVQRPVEVQTAGSAAEARALLSRQPDIDVVMCDVRMPGESGLDLLTWMRENGHRATRVLFSAHNPRSLPLEEVERAAPAAVYTKPLDLKRVAQGTNLAAWPLN